MTNLVRDKVTPGDGDPRHGRLSTYTNHQCRCDLCNAEHTRYCLARRDQREIPPPGDSRHGKYSTYTNYRCRCDLCRAANAQRARERASA